ncbi:MAG TPA: hypothetical protein VEX86_08955 [Longimicrobium sp.]|nr:hypothetical protein [Longimicrobium sp.]
MKHRLKLETLAVQSFETLDDDEAFSGNDSYRQCISELSHCGVCPTEPGTGIG